MMFDEHGHVMISPRDLQRRAADDPDGLINHALLPGTPMGFPTYDHFAKFLDYLTSKTGIHPHHFLFRGSTKIGFSISPSRRKVKVWRRFGPGSDLDLAMADPHFFASVDEQVRQWDRLPENCEAVYRYRIPTVINKYQARIDQKGRHDCYRFFDLPPTISPVSQLYKVLRGAPIAEYCSYSFIKFNAFVFRDRWAVHRRYYTDLADLRRGLDAGGGWLPQAPDEPFPHEMEQR